VPIHNWSSAGTAALPRTLAVTRPADFLLTMVWEMLALGGTLLTMFWVKFRFTSNLHFLSGVEMTK
jgi:hypothetical protein